MLRRSFRFGMLVGLVVGAAAAAVKMVQGRMSTKPAPAGDWAPIPNTEPVVVPTAPQPDTATPPAETESPPATKPAAKKAPAKKKAMPWVDPVGGTCPPSHPVKAKLSSKIFHLPGGLNYARTQPDRCYCDAAAAEADGLRQAKR